MKKSAAIAVGLGSMFLLAGCVGGSDGAKAQEGCIEEARKQLPSDVETADTSKLETVNMSDAMREVIENPLPPDPEDGVLWSTTGDIWYRVNGDDSSASVLCLTEFKNGEPVEPIEANVTF
ncbi:MAG TPA: hypothetical protein VIP55_06290 [Agromyces sp.]